MLRMRRQRKQMDLMAPTKVEAAQAGETSSRLDRFLKGLARVVEHLAKARECLGGFGEGSRSPEKPRLVLARTWEASARSLHKLDSDEKL